MIGTALFLLCATAVALADLDDTDGFYENGCPKDTSIDKLLSHENCGQYYQCFHGALISRFCPNGLNFNADLERCDWHARCNKRVEVNKTVFEELDNNNPRDAFLICSSPDSNDILVAHENCDEFYKCSHGRPVALKCARHLLYNTLTEKCDLRDNVDCGERVAGVSEPVFTITKKNTDVEESTLTEEIKNANSDPSQAIILCKSTQSDGLLIAHEYCNKFYKCSGGIPVPRQCPNRLFYDTVKGHCDWPMRVHCDGRIIPKDEVSENNEANEEKTYDYEENETSGDDDDTSPTGLCTSENSEGDVAAHETCNQFYKCLGKEPVAFKCPGNLLFNSKKNFCDWPNNVDCGDRNESGGSVGTREKKAHIICSAKGSDGVLATHKRCDKFYKCRDGYPVGIKCPGMLLYNPKTQKCDWPTHVNCTNRTVPKNGHPPHVYYSKDDIDSESKNQNENGDENNVDTENALDDKSNIDKENRYSEKNMHSVNFPSAKNNIEDESGYRQMIDGEVSNNVHGDNNNLENGNGYGKMNINSENVHDEKKHVKHKSGNSKISRYLSNARRICAGKNSEGKLLPHENCNQYFKCFESIPVAQFCQLHLFYNPVKEYCDWLQNVNCSKRIVPENNNYVEKENSYIDSSCTGFADGTILPHENCSQFYKCVNSQKYAMECLQGLYYNTVLKVCDWPMNVDCGNRLTEAEVRDQLELP